jgi:hypothetical protein
MSNRLLRFKSAIRIAFAASALLLPKLAYANISMTCSTPFLQVQAQGGNQYSADASGNVTAVKPNDVLSLVQAGCFPAGSGSYTGGPVAGLIQANGGLSVTNGLSADSANITGAVTIGGNLQSGGIFTFGPQTGNMVIQTSTSSGQMILFKNNGVCCTLELNSTGDVFPIPVTMATTASGGTITPTLTISLHNAALSASNLYAIQVTTSCGTAVTTGVGIECHAGWFSTFVSAPMGGTSTGNTGDAIGSKSAASVSGTNNYMLGVLASELTVANSDTTTEDVMGLSIAAQPGNVNAKRNDDGILFNTIYGGGGTYFDYLIDFQGVGSGAVLDPGGTIMGSGTAITAVAGLNFGLDTFTSGNAIILPGGTSGTLKFTAQPTGTAAYYLCATSTFQAVVQVAACP